MIARSLFFLSQAAISTAPAMAPPPQDWTRLPPLVLLRPVAQTPEASAFVSGEIRAGRCAHEGFGMTIDMAVFVAPGGQVRRIVPRAINCPTVEQYASGILLSMARGNVDTPTASGEGWYRTSITFTWGP